MPIIVRSTQAQVCRLVDNMERAKELVSICNGELFIDLGEDDNDPHCCGICSNCVTKICEGEKDENN